MPVTENDLREYITSTGADITLGEAWLDFADAYGWDKEESPYA